MDWYWALPVVVVAAAAHRRNARAPRERHRHRGLTDPRRVPSLGPLPAAFQPSHTHVLSASAEPRGSQLLPLRVCGLLLEPPVTVGRAAVANVKNDAAASCTGVF